MRPPLRRFFFADFFPGQEETRRADRNEGFAVRLWEPQASAREDVRRAPVRRLVKQKISQGKVWGIFF